MAGCVTGTAASQSPITKDSPLGDLRRTSLACTLDLRKKPVKQKSKVVVAAAAAVVVVIDDLAYS